MKYLNEYRDPESVRQYLDSIDSICTRSWNIMEVCGGQTHSILRYGLDRLLHENITLLHGPGCPVCVTPVDIIDRAIELASRENLILCTFGDMLRVPGSEKDLLSVKAEGGDVRIVYSPLDSLNIAETETEKEVVFLGIGFETTAPANAMAIFRAEKMKLNNFSILSAQVLIPPAIELILKQNDHNIDGFLAPGHVCTVSGYEKYERLASTYKIPIVVTGFEPLDLLQGIHMLVECLEGGKIEAANQYSRVVDKAGNKEARNMIDEVFEVCDRQWRGMGVIPASGLKIRERYARFNAESGFGFKSSTSKESSDCISGLVLRGKKKPFECPAFGNKCTPVRPLGAPMVSAEGACAAYYRYKILEGGSIFPAAGRP